MVFYLYSLLLGRKWGPMPVIDKAFIESYQSMQAQLKQLDKQVESVKSIIKQALKEHQGKLSVESYEVFLKSTVFQTIKNDLVRELLGSDINKVTVDSVRESIEIFKAAWMLIAIGSLLFFGGLTIGILMSLLID